MSSRDPAPAVTVFHAASAVVGRDSTIDVARGVAIVAIVVGHVLRGVAGAGLLDPEGTVAVVLDRTLYLFHLSVFAFLSGLFVARTVESRRPTEFLRDRVLLFLYLYVVWSVIQIAVKLLTGSLVNEPVDLAAALDLLRPEGQLWFLPWLIVASLLALIVRPWRSPRRAAITLGAAGVVAVVGWGTDFGFVGGQGLALYVFFVAGAVSGAARFTRISAGAPGAVLVSVALVGTLVLIGIGAFTTATVPTSYFDRRTGLTTLLGIAGSVAGTIAVLAASALVARVRWIVGPITAIGRDSLQIFLAHIIFAAGARIALTLLGVDDPVVVVLVASAVGIGGPMLLARVLTRLRFPWLFEAPWRRSRPASGTSA